VCIGISPGTVISSNLIHDTLPFYVYAHGIYLDQATTNVLVQNNIVYHTWAAAMYQHFGHDNLINNNVFASTKGST
jgi:parallel beta-helix repeat protein